MMRITDTVKHLIIINVVMFIGTLAISNGVFYDWFALRFPRHEDFRFWQIVTHMFMHGGIMHLALNMLGLWMFGSVIENALGAKRFLFIYFSAGLGALLLQLGEFYFRFLPDFHNLIASGISETNILKSLNSDYATEGISQNQYDTLKSLYQVFNVRMLGASGCVMGLTAAFGILSPNTELMMILFPVPVKAKYFVPGIVILETILGLSGKSIFGNYNVAHFAHVGGALTGAAIMWYWKKTQFNRNRWN